MYKYPTTQNAPDGFLQKSAITYETKINKSEDWASVLYIYQYT